MRRELKTQSRQLREISRSGIRKEFRMVGTSNHASAGKRSLVPTLVTVGGKPIDFVGRFCIFRYG